MNSLPLFHQVVGRKVVVLGEGDAAEAKRRLVQRAGGLCVVEPEAHHARLAFVAMDDRKAAEAAAIRLRCKGLIVNVTDRPELCDFTVPSIVDRDPVLVAVGTGGASAGLAKHVRLALERVLPQGLGMLAKALYASRDAIRTRWGDATDRRRALDTALGAGGMLDVLQEHGDDAVDRWLADDAEASPVVPVAIVLRSDDPDDLTIREARRLGMADVVVHDAGVPECVLARARADAVRIRAGETDWPKEGLVVILREPS